MSEPLASAAFVGIVAYIGMLVLIGISHVVLVLVFGPDREW